MEKLRAMTALAACRSGSSPARIIWTARFPTAVPSTGPASTVSPVERAVSSFKYVSWQQPPRMFRLVHVLPVRADSSRTASR